MLCFIGSLAVIHPYAYRNPRVSTDLPVEFVTEEGTLFGSAENVSENGLLVHFGEPVLPRTQGRLRLRVGTCLLELAAEASHLDGFRAGLVFAFASAQERTFVSALLQVIAKAQDLDPAPA
jgi:hypothetical protein